MYRLGNNETKSFLMPDMIELVKTYILNLKTIFQNAGMALINFNTYHNKESNEFYKQNFINIWEIVQ